MKRSLGLSFLFLSIVCSATVKDSTINYVLPDSVKAVSFMAEISIQSYNKKKFFSAGIQTDAVSLTIQNNFGKSQINFNSLVYPNTKMPAINTRMGRKLRDLIFNYDWQVSDKYKLLIAQATDSAGNFSLYSGYIFLPRENKWKLIGTVKIKDRWNSIQSPAVFYGGRNQKLTLSLTTSQVWCQRQNGSWKNMLQNNFTPPVVNFFSHVDSVEQLQIEKKVISQAISENKIDVKQEHEGIYYTVLKEGTGKQVSINDTVIAYYKGYLFSDSSVFDETKDKPATFPLNRLIKGWQIGVPLCKVGGKIKLVIPSNLAYSIRTRAAKIPPNSILVFEIEVVDARSPQ